ncbi:MAG: hypothetical protein FWG29_02995 [Treponema sp.]|nr:hypothetical protein [Treponema sp.]
MIEPKGKFKNLRLVPAVVFIYDCSRLLFLVALSGVFLRPGPDLKSINFPLMMFVSPNALFPLISFFLLIRFDIFKAYIPLYITGKALCLVCLTVWLFFGLRQILGIREILWPVFLSAADLASIMGTALYNTELPYENSGAEAPRTNVHAAEGGE